MPYVNDANNPASSFVGGSTLAAARNKQSKAYSVVFLALFQSMLFGCQPSQNEIWERAIVGVWSHASTYGDASVEGKTSYLPGGRMTVTGTLKYKDAEDQLINGSGKWHVKDGWLHYTMEVSTLPDILPNGYSSADKIIRVTDKELVYVNDDGETVTDFRVLSF